KNIQEAVEFYETFKAKQSHKSVNDAFRAERARNVERRVNANPRLANLYNSLERGLEKSANEQRAKKEQENINRARQQEEERHARAAEIERNSGWLFDAIKRKRGE
ncbi:MAG: hypothetical protein SOZ62_03385, partial [Eubacteriales bacterium]|nr:hypothetical protein [Eubacteriales bacterium]